MVSARWFNFGHPLGSIGKFASVRARASANAEWGNMITCTSHLGAFASVASAAKSDAAWDSSHSIHHLRRPLALLLTAVNTTAEHLFADDGGLP